MTRLVSNVYHMAYGPAPTVAEERDRNIEARKTAWQRHGLAVIDPEDIHDDWLRQAIINEADKAYGRRGRR